MKECFNTSKSTKFLTRRSGRRLDRPLALFESPSILHATVTGIAFHPSQSWLWGDRVGYKREGRDDDKEGASTASPGDVTASSNNSNPATNAP